MKPVFHFTLKILAAVCILSFFAAAAIAQQNTDAPPKDKLSTEEKQQKQLVQILEQKLLLEKELAKISKEKPSQEESKRAEEIDSELKVLTRKFDALATQLQNGEVVVEERRDLTWMEELREITRPLLAALRDITERPRKIENLKTRIQSLKQQIAAYEKARGSLEKMMQMEFARPLENGEQKEPEIATAELKKSFKTRLAKLKKKYNPEFLVLDLEEAQNSLRALQSSENFSTSFIQEFLQVRGRNLLIALAAFLVFWIVLTALYRFFAVRMKLLSRLDPHYQKVIKAAYSLFIFLFCSTASVVALYLLDDWLILSIVILVFAGMALGFREFIPKFIRELRLILNLGTVREKERLIWQGVPWKVQEIGVYAILRNPRLQGGMVKLHVGELVGLHSRPLVLEEEWFPTKVDDWVILSDDTFGRVIKQTAEQVVVESFASRKYFKTTDFLGLKPRNLSTGYRIVIRFGLDYGVQSRITDELPRLFKERLREIFKKRFDGDDPDIQTLQVRFDSAADSSLKLIVLFKMHGRCAEDYYPLQWEINRRLVQICNENQLVIPFTQLTISPSQDLKTWASPALDGSAEAQGQKSK